MDEPKITLTTSYATDGFRVGDVLVFEFRQPWWKRLLMRLGLLKQRRYVITSVGANEMTVG